MQSTLQLCSDYDSSPSDCLCEEEVGVCSSEWYPEADGKLYAYRSSIDLKNQEDDSQEEETDYDEYELTTKRWLLDGIIIRDKTDIIRSLKLKKSNSQVRVYKIINNQLNIISKKFVVYKFDAELGYVNGEYITVPKNIFTDNLSSYFSILNIENKLPKILDNDTESSSFITTCDANISLINDSNYNICWLYYFTPNTTTVNFNSVLANPQNINISKRTTCNTQFYAPQEDSQILIGLNKTAYPYVFGIIKDNNGNIINPILSSINIFDYNANHYIFGNNYNSAVFENSFFILPKANPQSSYLVNNNFLGLYSMDFNLSYNQSQIPIRYPYRLYIAGN
ncbi:MAG: hypothetical protein V1824_01315 [archaeon]